MMTARRCGLAIALIWTSSVFAAPTVDTPVTQRKDMMVYAPVPRVPPEAKAKHLAGRGLFLFHVQPDGTVSSVDVIQSTGHKILDDASVEAFSTWRFKSGSPPKVKIPVIYTGNYPKLAK